MINIVLGYAKESVRTNSDHGTERRFEKRKETFEYYGKKVRINYMSTVKSIVDYHL